MPVTIDTSSIEYTAECALCNRTVYSLSGVVFWHCDDDPVGIGHDADVVPGSEKYARSTS